MSTSDPVKEPTPEETSFAKRIDELEEGLFKQEHRPFVATMRWLRTDRTDARINAVREGLLRSWLLGPTTLASGGCIFAVISALLLWDQNREVQNQTTVMTNQTKVAKQQAANAQEQAEIAKEQATHASIQADAAVRQLRMSDIERFRQHVSQLSRILTEKTPMPSGHEFVRHEVGYEQVVPVLSDNILEQTEAKIRYERSVEFVLEARVALARVVEAVEETLAGDGGIPTLVDAFTHYEAAVDLEAKIPEDVLSMEYVLLSTYAYVLSGTEAAESFIEKALKQIEDEQPGYRHVALYTTLGTFYYRNHPQLDASKGAKFFQAARDLYRQLPDTKKSVQMQYQLWVDWAALEYTIGNVTDGSAYEAEAWTLIDGLPQSERKKEELKIRAAGLMEVARMNGNLKRRSRYSLGTFEKHPDEYIPLSSAPRYQRIFEPRPLNPLPSQRINED